MDASAQLESEPVNMNRVSSMDTLTAYFDNTLGGLQMVDGTVLPDLDEILNNQTMFGDTSPLQQSQNDLDIEYQDFAFEEIPNFDEEEDKSNSSCSEIDEHETTTGPKKYRQPACLRGANLSIGTWKLNDPSKAGESTEPFNLEVKFLFGRRKIKYEMTQSNSKKTLVIDYDFAQITGLQFKAKSIIVQISELPNFSAKERGKCNKVADFTQGNGSHYQRHVIELANNIDEHTEHLLLGDKRLHQLSEMGLPAIEGTFSDDKGPISTVVCDWDKENTAQVFCAECKSNYCDDCDDVLHRHASRKQHKRVPITNQIAKPKKTKKRKKSDRCRCGTGATKGTLGDPCTGNRCPCYSSGKGCSSCGCKNCNNPYKKPQTQNVSLSNESHVVQL